MYILLKSADLRNYFRGITPLSLPPPGRPELLIVFAHLLAFYHFYPVGNKRWIQPGIDELYQMLVIFTAKKQARRKLLIFRLEARLACFRNWLVVSGPCTLPRTLYPCLSA
jgi:hypothetical protein